MPIGITISSTSNLSSGQKILVSKARDANEPAAPNPSLVDVVNIPQGHKQWDMSRFARLAQATALTEGTDLSSPEQLVTNTVTITPSEHGIIAVLSKRLMRRQGDSSVMAKAGALIGASLMRREDNDIIALFDTYTKSVVGAGSPLDVTYFRGTVAYLMTDNNTAYGPAEMPLRASLHSEQISDIVLDLTDIGGTSAGRAPLSGGLSEDLIQRWWRGRDRVYGVQVFLAGNIARDANDDSKGAIFNGGSLGLVHANTAEVTVDDDPSLRAEEHGIFQEWGEALLVDPWGVEVFSDTIATV